MDKEQIIAELKGLILQQDVEYKRFIEDIKLYIGRKNFNLSMYYSGYAKNIEKSKEQLTNLIKRIENDSENK